eukprot:3810243-Pyramimonas_sp.AAC.1
MNEGRASGSSELAPPPPFESLPPLLGGGKDTRHPRETLQRLNKPLQRGESNASAPKRRIKGFTDGFRLLGLFLLGFWASAKNRGKSGTLQWSKVVLRA